jgi:hypothetical protein
MRRIDMVTSAPAPLPISTLAKELPTAATLAADCAALISELKWVRARLRTMDEQHIVFQNAGAPTAAKTKGKPSKKNSQPTVEFVRELAERLDRINDRLDETRRTVRELGDRGIVTSGFPSGLSKGSNPSPDAGGGG